MKRVKRRKGGEVEKGMKRRLEKRGKGKKTKGGMKRTRGNRGDSGIGERDKERNWRRDKPKRESSRIR